MFQHILNRRKLSACTVFSHQMIKNCLQWSFIHYAEKSSIIFNICFIKSKTKCVCTTSENDLKNGSCNRLRFFTAVFKNIMNKQTRSQCKCAPARRSPIVAFEDMINHNSWTDRTREPLKTYLDAEDSKNPTDLTKTLYTFTFWNADA